MIKNLLSLICIFCLVPAFAGDIPIGYWRSHMPYAKGFLVADAGIRIYCASTSSLFSFSTLDNSITTYSKSNGLSDVNISAIRYNAAYDILAIAYKNTNFDFLQNNAITNLSDIKRKNITGKKEINSIYFIDRYALLSCSFGIVLMDLVKKEVSDTWYIGDGGESLNVNETVFDGTTLFAATDIGILKALYVGTNLADYTSWTLDTGLPTGVYTHAELAGGKVYVNRDFPGDDVMYRYDGTTWSLFVNFTSPLGIGTPSGLQSTSHYFSAANGWRVALFDTSGSIITMFDQNWTYDKPLPVDAVYNGTDILWVADANNGLVKYEVGVRFDRITPDGPPSKYSAHMTSGGGILWVAPGAVNAQQTNLYLQEGIYYFRNGEWDSVSYRELDYTMDIMTVLVDPLDPDHLFASGWGRGLLELKNFKLVQLWDGTTTNGAFQSIIPNAGIIRIPGSAFDLNGNLWVTVNRVERLLAVMDTSRTWRSYALKNTPSNGVGPVTIDSNNIKWMIFYGFGVYAFDENGTLDDETDDRSRYLTTGIGYGNLPTNYCNAIVTDLAGDIWVGTTKGIAVFYTPWQVFDSETFDAQQIYVYKDGYTQYLLEFEEVTVIAVDGANRKWIGTRNAGVFLVSPDGTQELEHFTSSNSPLPSDEVQAIAIDQLNGEVFFGTSEGIASFRSTATIGGINFNNIFVYPNPITEDYEGPIAINGLVANARVKITDVGGDLIYETVADGGQAIWDGKNFSGRKAGTGVYLIFCASPDGNRTAVAKILIIN